MEEVLFWLLMLCIWIVLWVFGLLPQQRARAQARRQERAAARLARLQQIAAARQRQQWHEIVERQQARGHAGFADEAEAAESLGGPGGRRSTLDERWF